MGRIWSQPCFCAGSGVIFVILRVFDNKEKAAEVRRNFHKRSLDFAGSMRLRHAGRLCQRRIQNPYAKAYYEGRYEIAEGMPEEIQTTKLGTSIYVDGEEYYYDGGKVVIHGEKVKLYYVDDGDGGNYVVRIDAYRAVPYFPE